MTDELEKRRSGMGWGIPASVLLHVVFAFVLFFHLPLDFSEPQKEESVNVEIVPPPEEPEKKAEEQPKAAEEPQPEDVKKEEVPPPPPEPPKQEEAKKEEPPPPEPEPEQKPKEQPPANEQARGQPIPVLRPVFEFGEKDAGPRKAGEGNSPEEGAAMSPPETEPEKPAELPKPPADEPPGTEAAEVSKPATAQQEPAEAPPANPVPDDIQLPEVDVTATNPEQDGPISQAAPADTKTEIVATQPVAPTTEPAKTPPPDKPSELTEAKTLFSQSETDDPIATTAMGNVPRGVRAGELCATEMQAQLRHASPSFRPDILPVFRLPQGNMLDVKRVAFRANAQWYDLSFRCEVDEDAMKVLSFAFKVGAPVPRSEWRKRGFPN